MEILIVGAGEMGRWFADAVDAAGVDVAFADRDPEVAATAAAAVGGRAVALDGEETFEAVCVAVPMDAATAVVEAVAPRASEAILDVTGTMADPVAAMAAAAPDRERVSLHPLFAAENAPGNVAVVADAPGPVTDDLRAALSARGNRLFETTAAEHDRAMRTVQAAAHSAVLAFALAAEPVDERFATPVYEDVAALVDRVTGNNPRVYADIQAAFDGADAVAEAAARIAAADDDEFVRLYEAASADDGPPPSAADRGGDPQ